MASNTSKGTKRDVRIRAQPLIAVRDVELSSRWYQRLLSCKSGHGGKDYEQLVNQGKLVLQLHAWDVDEHPNLTAPDAAPHGHGVLLWFKTTDFDAVAQRARELAAEIIEEPHVNPNSGGREIWLRDPDGYVLVIASG